VEGPERVFAQDRAEGINQGFPQGGPVTLSSGRQRDLHRGRARPDRGYLRLREPGMEFLLPGRPLIRAGHPGGEQRRGRGSFRLSWAHRKP
jgi:hypothetical protein